MELTGDQQAGEPKGRQKKGTGSKFAVLDRAIARRLWKVPTVNRLNLLTAFLVMLVGTGADHRTTSWSARACEERAGMGKPRAKRAIEELISAKLVERAPGSEPNRPKYLLAEPKFEQEPIFLPVQLVTGFGDETPVLKRVRETGDPLVLKMLIDLYGELQIDATYGVPLASLRMAINESATKVAEVGLHTVWALKYGSTMSGAGEWVQAHHDPHNKDGEWENFWRRLKLLQQVGALKFEPWLFDGEALDAEPIMPIDPLAIYTQDQTEVAKLTQLAYQASAQLLQNRLHLLDQFADATLVPLPAHHQTPSLRGVAKLIVEADTPARRRAFAKRKAAIDARRLAFEAVASAKNARPMSLVTKGRG